MIMFSANGIPPDTIYGPFLLTLILNRSFDGFFSGCLLVAMNQSLFVLLEQMSHCVSKPVFAND
jgi:hypothetical protein